MRLVRPLSLLSLSLLVACVGGDDATPRAPDALDCTWVESDQNCFRAMALAVEACLGSTSSKSGVLAADRLSCAYESGRTVTSALPLGATDSSLEPSRDFVVKNDVGVECVRVQEAASLLTVTYAGGAVRLSTEGDQVQVSCPSGGTFTGTDAALRGCLSPASGVPGYAWFSNATDTAPATRVTFLLLGASSPLFACAVAP